MTTEQKCYRLIGTDFFFFRRFLLWGRWHGIKILMFKGEVQYIEFCLNYICITRVLPSKKYDVSKGPAKQFLRGLFSLKGAHTIQDLSKQILENQCFNRNVYCFSETLNKDNIFKSINFHLRPIDLLVPV